MADLMSGPNAPLTRAFIFCGWRCITIDWLINPQHDLAHPAFQQELHETLQQADCICAALDCSTKSRAREIPRKFEDGRPAPKPLRSDEHPTGLPHLRGSDLRRVTKDNQACDFVLQEIQELADRGGVSLRENPARSLHWELPREKQMLASGDWQDTCYAACCFMGARCKQQRLRHNIQEISQWPPLQCHHQHDPDEWKPYTLDGQRVFPSHEEAEYTAPLAFAIAVSTSWWAVRVGRAKLRVPRMPPTETVGRREHWLHYDPRSTRSWAMTPLAIQLGLRPIDPRERARVPRVRRAVDLLVDGHLPSKCIYVGRGHHSHKLPLSKWCSPYTPGHDCTADEWLPCYVEFIMSSRAAELPELAGCTLACDCPHDSDVCEADALAGLVFDATAPEAPRYLAAASGQAQRHHSTASRALRLGVIPSRGVAASLPARVGLFTQESVVTCFRRLFPGTWFQDFKFPMIEDLLNQAPFCEFPRWRDQHDLKADGPLGPHLASAALRQRQRHAEGQQAGALSHKAALPPLLSFGLDPDTHFQRACLRSQAPIPTEQSPLLDDDLWFVAELYASRSEDLPRLREQSLGILKELKQRWGGVGEHLRTFQTSAIRAVTRSRDIGLTALLVTLTSWADITYPYGLVAGLPAVGTAPPYGVFPEQPGRSLTMEDVLDDWETHNYKTLAALKPGRHDAVLLEQSLNDAAQGFCSAPLTQAQLLRELRGEPFRLIPRCVIVQSSGKKRIIDNGDTGGQSERSSDWNKLVLCSPLRPAQHVGAVASLLTDEQWHTLTTADEWQSGGEDWPNAYRHSPISQAESRGCIVCFWHAERGEPAFQVYSSLLFGLPLAVTSFNRYSRLIEALGRRLTYSLVSLYFDDAHITDLQSGLGSSQQAFCQLNTLLGTPFAEEKKQLMQPTGTFLGLDHDFTNLSRGFVTFWARDRLIQKTAAMITEAQTQQPVLRPGIQALRHAQFSRAGHVRKVGMRRSGSH